MHGRLTWLLALALGAVLGACGGSDEPGGADDDAANPPAVAWIDPEGEAPVVGSLAVNPADKVLWMATNTGLFRVPEGAKAPERVTGTLQVPDGSSGKISEGLVVRFTGPDEMLGSGHPPPDETSLPELLGLIRSTDGGRTWSSVSELGTADFHAIERSGNLTVGSQFGQSQILASSDEGRTWRARTSPSVLVDLEVDPGNPKRWVATSAEGIFRSPDEGKTWRPIETKPNSYLAWPTPDALYRLDPGGPVQVSADGGGSWEARGSTGGEPQALVADGPDTLYALLLDGTLKKSTDGGRQWSTLVSPPASG